MKSFDHILFPVDFSTRCLAARPAVASWAERFHARITLLHTIQIPVSAYGGPDGYPVMIDVPGIEGAAKDRLDRFEMAGAEERNVERAIAMGDPAYEVVQYAEKHKVDLIMLPTHGYGTFRSLLLGSTAAKVLHDARCPVWTSAHTPDIPKNHEIRSILCAMETGPGSVEFLRSSQELAEAWGAKLRLVHAVPIDDTRPEKYLEGEIDTKLMEAGREEIARVQREAGMDLEARVAGGQVSHVVRAAAQEFNADLVIEGGGKIHGAFARLRSHAYAIIRESPCPVLSL